MTGPAKEIPIEEPNGGEPILLPPDSPLLQPIPFPKAPEEVQRMHRFEKRLEEPLIAEHGRRTALGVEHRRLDTHKNGYLLHHLLAVVDVTADRTVASVPFPGLEKSNGRTWHDADVREVGQLVPKAESLLAGVRWLPMTSLETRADPMWPARHHGLGGSSPTEAFGEDIVIQFHEPELIVKVPGKRILFRKRLPTWSKPPGLHMPGCLVFADLGRAWASRRHGVVVVEVRFSASPHACAFQSITHALRVAARW